ASFDRPRLRKALLVAVLALMSAAAAYAIVSSLVGSGGSSSAAASSSATASSSAAASSKPAWLGVDMQSFPGAAGVLVADVASGSPAAAAGLEPGDVITQVANRPVTSPADVDSVLAGMHAGDRLELQYARGPIVYTTEVALA